MPAASGPNGSGSNRKPFHEMRAARAARFLVVFYPGEISSPGNFTPRLIFEPYGVAPGSYESAGKRKTSKTRRAIGLCARF